MGLAGLWLLLLCSEYLLAMEINGTAGQDLSISFPFKASFNHTLLKYANLYKNGNKTAEWWAASSPDTSSHLYLSVTSSKVAVIINRLMEADSGSYHVTLFYNDSSADFIESLKVLLSVHLAITDAPPVNSMEPPEGNWHSAVIVYITCGLGIAVLSVMLLSWFCLTQRSSANQLPQESPSSKQVTHKYSSQLPGRSIEYGVLDFQSRPSEQNRDQSGGSRPEVQDNVEYSVIIFQQRAT